MGSVLWRYNTFDGDTTLNKNLSGCGAVFSTATLRSSLPFCFFRIATLSLVGLLVALFSCSAMASPTHVKLYPLPAEVSSTHFRVSINGAGSDVMQAASNYYLLNFDTDGPVRISVTADDPHFWDGGVEIQPMRLGIRPYLRGDTLTFVINGPEKLTIGRPGDHFADADLLFLFANPMDNSGIAEKTPGVRYFGPGIYHENIDAQAGETIYLDGGAVIFGSLNIWLVKNVRVLGRGTIIYDGPQNPNTDVADGMDRSRTSRMPIVDGSGGKH